MLDWFNNLISISWWRTVFQKSSKVFGWGCAAVFGLPLVIGIGWNQYQSRSTPSQTNNSRESVIMTVNGIPVTVADFNERAAGIQSAPVGDRAAGAQAMVLAGSKMRQQIGLVDLALVEWEAKKRGVKPTEADIDRAIQAERDQLGKNVSQSDWETYLERAHGGVSEADFRDFKAKHLYLEALISAMAGQETVSQDDAKNQTSQVKLRLVLVSTTPPSMFGMKPKATNALTDSEALAKATALLAEAQSGKDLAAIAKAHSGDFMTKDKGGATDLEAEYLPSDDDPTDHGALGFGRAFDDAVHKTAPGQFTNIVKSNSANPGYVFARVEARKNDLPKGFNVQTAVATLKKQRAAIKLQKIISDDEKTAKVVFPADQIEKKAYYEYGKYQNMQTMQMMQQMNGPSADLKDMPSQAEMDALKVQYDSDFLAAFEKDKTNPTLALMAANGLKEAELTAKTQAERTKIHDQRIALYLAAHNSTEGEDYSVPFTLADLYKDNRQYKDADKQYKLIARLVDVDEPTDLNGYKNALQDRLKLQSGFRSVQGPDVPDAQTDADAQDAKIKVLNIQIAAEQAKQKQAEADAKKADAAAKMGAPTTSLGNLKIGPGSGSTQINVPSSPGSGTSKVTIPAAPITVPTQAPTKSP